jgi:DNA invertase Pin-like site-specific DNA recombinase
MNSTTALRGIIYARQSLDRNGDQLAITRQLSECERLCTQRGYTQVAEPIVENDTSASSTRKRKGYTQLLAMVKSGQVDIIVAYSVDRLTRKLSDLEALIDLVEATGVTVVTLSGDLDLSTPAGRLNARILASVARGEVETKAARQVLRNRQAVKAGRALAGGMRTIGYVDRRLSELHPTEAPLITAGYEQLVAGQSARGIARQWNEAGMQTSRGGAWNSNTVKMALTNPRYAGIAVYRSNRVNSEVMGIGEWQPLVSRDVWDTAQTILTDPARKTSPGGQERKYLMSGLAVCADCGGVMRSAQVSGKRVYRCPRLNLTRRVEQVDSFVREVVAAHLRQPGGPDLAASDGVDTAALRSELAALSSKMERLPALWMDGKLTEAQMVQGTADCQARKDAISTALAAAAGEWALGPVLAAVDPGAAFLEAPLDVQRAVVSHLVTVTLQRLGRGTWRKPFDPSSITLTWH